MFYFSLYVVPTVISIWCCPGKFLALILLFFRHLDWIWAVEALRGFFLPYWKSGIVLWVFASPWMATWTWSGGGLLFCSSFNSWKAFLSWCYVPAYPPYGKGHRIFSQDWEPAMGKQELACTMDSVNQTLALTDFQLETYQMALLSLEINQALYTLPDFYWALKRETHIQLHCGLYSPAGPFC